MCSASSRVLHRPPLQIAFSLPASQARCLFPFQTCSKLSFSTASPAQCIPMGIWFYGGMLLTLVSAPCNRCGFPVWGQEFNSTTSCLCTPSPVHMGQGTQGLFSTSAGQGHRPWAFLPFSSHPLVRGNVNGVRDRIMTDSQTQVCNGAHAIFLHQDVL